MELKNLFLPSLEYFNAIENCSPNLFKKKEKKTFCRLGMDQNIQKRNIENEVITIQLISKGKKKNLEFGSNEINKLKIFFFNKVALFFLKISSFDSFFGVNQKLIKHLITQIDKMANKKIKNKFDGKIWYILLI